MKFVKKKFFLKPKVGAVLRKQTVDPVVGLGRLETLRPGGRDVSP